jgi:hypothetical protein
LYQRKDRPLHGSGRGEYERGIRIKFFNSKVRSRRQIKQEERGEQDAVSKWAQPWKRLGGKKLIGSPLCIKIVVFK